jgi:hypothetical protein
MLPSIVVPVRVSLRVTFFFVGNYLKRSTLHINNHVAMGDPPALLQSIRDVFITYPLVLETPVNLTDNPFP